MRKRIAILCAAVLLIGCFGFTAAAAEGNLKAEFAKVRANIKEYVLDMEYANASEENKQMYDKRVANFVKQTQELSATMNKSAASQKLWDDNEDVGTNFDRLTTMAKAYVMDGSELKGNASLFGDIISGMEFVYLNQYNETTAEIGNWWSWEIGYARKSAQLVAVMFDHLTSAQVERYLRGVRHFCPDTRMNNYNNGGSVSTGANRTDVCYSIIIESALKEDEARLKDALAATLEVLEYVTKDDGFYDDGSFIQHGTVAYTYSYGDALMNTISLNLSFAGGTVFNVVDNPLVENLYTAVYKSYEPLIYKGAAFDMVRGRAVSRNASGQGNAQSVLNSILRISQFAPEEHANHFKSFLKYHVQNNTALDYMASTTNIGNRSKMKAILDDPNIEPIPEPNYNVIYNSMDRVTNFRPGWAVGLAMNSSRVARFESINNENLKGWYQGEGTLYLYNDDQTHYGADYFVTIDPYRYPGTTVSKKKRADVSGTGTAGLSTKDWAGSTGLDGMYSVSGMEVEGYDNTMTAKKSWFMFDDEIVCLGADINAGAGDGAAVETIVENRKLTESNDNTILIDGAELLTGYQEETSFPNVSWVHLEGNVEGADIGYYFPTATYVGALRESRENDIQDGNPTVASKIFTNNYFTMWLDHGMAPKGETYSYVLLPGKTAEETKAYAANSGITILENSAEAQAVTDENLHITGINFWEERTKTVDDVTCNTAATVMLKRTDTELEISICDPTQKQTAAIDLSMPDEGYRVVSADNGVSVKQSGGTLQISADVYNARGKSFNVKLEKRASDPSGGEVFDSRTVSGIALLEGCANAIVDGEKKVIDSADSSVVPCQQDNRVYVPLRFLAESLGAEVAWDNGTQTATVTSGNTEITVDTLRQTIAVGGALTEGKSIMQGDRILVPVRLVSETLGKKVYWHSKGLIVVGDSEKLFNAATEEHIIDSLIGQILG